MGLWKKIKKATKRATNWVEDKVKDVPDTYVKVATLGAVDGVDELKEGAKNVATFGMYGEAEAARLAQEAQYAEQQAAAAKAIEDAKTAESTAISEAAAKTEAERKKRLLYGRASTFVSGGLGGSSNRKTLLGA